MTLPLAFKSLPDRLVVIVEPHPVRTVHEYEMWRAEMLLIELRVAIDEARKSAAQ